MYLRGPAYLIVAEHTVIGFAGWVWGVALTLLVAAVLPLGCLLLISYGSPVAKIAKRRGQCPDAQP